jgi:Ser/Thr protein kinase RdoA (MazF antagonist)/acetylornithine/succinyldiaminopimelate/putrescine aminotransferase
MSDVMPELLDVSSTDLSIEAVEEVLREQYGLTGQVFPIEGRQNPYFLIDNGHMRYLLKTAPADAPFQEIEAEHALMRHILRSTDGPLVPEPVLTKDGADTIALPLEGEDRRLRLLTFLEGAPLPADDTLSDRAITAFGSISAALTKSLDGIDNPLLEREPESDLRKAGPQTVTLLAEVSDQETRDVIAKAMVAALRRIQPLGPSLRIAAVHQNLDAGAVVGNTTDAGWLPTGVTDFTGISRSWLVAGFANTCAFLLANRGGDALALLPAIRAYHDIYPLTLTEIEALWPLIVARTGILAAEAESKLAQRPDDAQAREETERRHAVLRAVTAISPALVFATFLDATGVTNPLPAMVRLLPDIDPETIRLVDLGITSPLLYGGNWTDPENDWKMLARIARETGRCSTRYGEYRLSKSLADPQQEPENFALHIDVCVPAGVTAVAPFAGTLKSGGTRLVLSGSDLNLHVEGLDCALGDGTAVNAGDMLGTIAGAENSVGGLRLRFCRDSELVPPLFCTAEKVGTWSRLCPSPAALLGVLADAPVSIGLDEPVRGWKEHLFDAAGRCLIDLREDTPLVGHSHPRLAAASYRQLLLLNAPSPGPSEAEELLARHLKALAPTGLDQILALHGRRDAFQHALVLARNHTGRREIVGMSGLLSEMAGEPTMIKAGSAQDIIESLDAGDKAGLLLPGHALYVDGISEILVALRRNDGLLVIDETRSGWGRSGRYLWGFEVSGLSPDIVVAGLPGQDIAVCFARENIAVARDGAERPSLVACSVAAATLEISAEEALRDNARIVGDHLKSAIELLARRHPVIQDVTGSGFCLALHFKNEELAKKTAELLRSERVLANLEPPASLLIVPPLCFARDSADQLVDRLEAALAQS